MENAILPYAKALLNLIYPLRCQICKRGLMENVGLCESCISKIGKYEFGNASSQYDGVLKEAVHLFKYKGVSILITPFSRLLLEFIDRNIDMKKIDMIIPIPLHPVRLRERGFNQAYLLSIPIAKRYNIPISTGHLIKIRPTEPQSNLNRTKRLKNLKNAFWVKDGEYLKKKRVLLIDDVYTTGTTIKEASLVLKKAGVRSIKVVTLAKGA